MLLLKLSLAFTYLILYIILFLMKYKWMVNILKEIKKISELYYRAVLLLWSRACVTCHTTKGSLWAGVWRPGSSIRHGRMTVVFFTGDRLSETKNDSFIRSREYYLWHQHHYPEAPEKHLVKNTVRRDGFSSFLWWFLSL